MRRHSFLTPFLHHPLPPSLPPSYSPHFTEAVVAVTKAVAGVAVGGTSAKRGPTRLFNASMFWMGRARMALLGVGLSMAWSFTRMG